MKSILIFLICTYTLNALATDIAITIDDLPSTNVASRKQVDIIKSLTTALQQHKAPALGFIIGKRIFETDGENALKIWIESGFPISNHTWSHKRLEDSNLDWFIKDIERLDPVLEDLTKKKGTWLKAFRFPTLNQGNSLEKWTRMNNYFIEHSIIAGHVSADTSDWAFATAYEHLVSTKKINESIKLKQLYLEHILDCIDYFNSLSQKIFHREIPLILLIHASALNADSLPMILESLKKENHFVSFEEAIKDSAYMPYKYIYPHFTGDNFLKQIAKTKNMTIDEDRSSYDYFLKVWKPKIDKL